MSRFGLRISVIVASALLFSCGKSVVEGANTPVSAPIPVPAPMPVSTVTDTGSATAMLSFNGIDPAHRGHHWINAPVYFGIKFLTAYLTEDIDPVTKNNVGKVSKIYLNPACTENTDCLGANQINRFFDLARSSSDVNNEMNGQIHIVTPGSYKFVQIDLCVSGGTGNVGFKEFERDAITLTTSSNCERSSVELFPALTIEDKDKVMINLNYSLNNTLVACGKGDVFGCNANGKSVVFPTFNPTASKL